MARKRFKSWWKRYVPEPIERSTYILLSSVVLMLLFWQWRPVTNVVWSVRDAGARIMVTALFWVGWVLVVTGTYSIDHLELFGLRQAYAQKKGRQHVPIGFKTPILYKLVRHPIMLGYVMALWSASRMTSGHLYFAVIMTTYILVGIRFEERDLRNIHGAAYEEYQQRVPMLLPVPKIMSFIHKE